ncbi:hypothetical protein NP493_8049g00000 [Ridgeia piscesae]|uniref:Uncharacterized protein n=1 Tax=Ridgeia piscesae TaxID=27915 RepID=A0AAD9IQC8_RIDPI|nr:hypothetical protein NP493_8049g00000 [Ridgeia piscesae]
MQRLLICSLDVCLAAASTDACVNIRQRAKTCRFTIAEFLGSYPREASSFGPARGCNVDSGLPLHNNSAHISFTPTVTYSLTPGMTAVPGGGCHNTGYAVSPTVPTANFGGQGDAPSGPDRLPAPASCIWSSDISPHCCPSELPPLSQVVGTTLSANLTGHATSHTSPSLTCRDNFDTADL